MMHSRLRLGFVTELWGVKQDIDAAKTTAQVLDPPSPFPSLDLTARLPGCPSRKQRFPFRQKRICASFFTLCVSPPESCARQGPQGIPSHQGGGGGGVPRRQRDGEHGQNQHAGDPCHLPHRRREAASRCGSPLPSPTTGVTESACSFRHPHAALRGGGRQEGEDRRARRCHCARKGRKVPCRAWPAHPLAAHAEPEAHHSPRVPAVTRPELGTSAPGRHLRADSANIVFSVMLIYSLEYKNPPETASLVACFLRLGTNSNTYGYKGTAI